MKRRLKVGTKYKCGKKGCESEFNRQSERNWHTRHSHQIEARFECRGTKIEHAHYTQIAKDICLNGWKGLDNNIHEQKVIKHENKVVNTNSNSSNGSGHTTSTGTGNESSGRIL